MCGSSCFFFFRDEYWGWPGRTGGRVGPGSKTTQQFSAASLPPPRNKTMRGPAPPSARTRAPARAAAAVLTASPRSAAARDSKADAVRKSRCVWWRKEGGVDAAGGAVGSIEHTAGDQAAMRGRGRRGGGRTFWAAAFFIRFGRARILGRARRRRRRRRHDTIVHATHAGTAATAPLGTRVRGCPHTPTPTPTPPPPA